MPIDQLETLSGRVGIYGAMGVALGHYMEWLTANATAVGIFIAFCGLLIQLSIGTYNIIIKQAENRRKEEEHKLKMEILRGERPDHRLNLE